MGTKRTAINIDPDYEDVTEHHNKRQRLLEEDAKETTRKKIEKIICDQFMIEEMQKEREVDIIDQKLCQARQMMDRLRACIVANFYSSTGQQKMFQVKSSSQQQVAIHPTVKEHLGKKPKFTDSTMPETKTEDMILKNKFTTSVKLETKCSIEIKKEPVEEAQENSNSAVPDQSTSRTSRYKVKKRIIVGNVSKYIPVDKREENDQSTHKWMVYVRGSKDEPKIDHFVKKVWFFLHPSYRPNDLVEVSQPPFHLTRRGWGEFPVRIQLHFYDQRNKRVDIIHPLKLDRTYTGLQTLGAETVVDVELEREKTVSSSLSGMTSIDATSMFKFGRKDSSVKVEPGVKNEQNFTIAEQITPKKIKTDSELYKRLSEGQVTPKSKGKITPSPKGTFSDFLNSKSSPSSKGVESHVDISLDNSNLSNKENFYEGVGKLKESPSKSEVNMQPHLLNIVTPVLKAGGITGENIVKQSSSVGQPQNASYSSMGTPTGIITVNKVTDGSGLSSFMQSPSNVQVVLGGFGSLTSPGVSDAKSPITTGSAGVTLNPVGTDNKQLLVVGGTSSTAKPDTLILASNSPSQCQSIMNKKAKSKSVSPGKATTSQSSSTIILQGMGSLSKSSVTGGNKNNNNGQFVSESSSSANVSPVKSGPMDNPVSNQSSLYIRCRDSQGNIFLVPQHLLKQITNPADKTNNQTSAISGLVSLPQNTVTSSQVLPQQPVVQMSSSMPSNKNDSLASSTLVSSSESLKAAKPELQNISFSDLQGKGSPSKSLPPVSKVTEGNKNASSSSVKQQNNIPLSVISGSVISSPVVSESLSAAALKTSMPQIVVRFPQGDELNSSSGTSLLNSSHIQAGSGNVAPGSPRGQLKVTSQGLKVVPTNTPSVTIDRSGNLIPGFKTSQQQTSILKSDKQPTRKNMTVSALLKENASQSKQSLVKTSQISSLKQGQSGDPSTEMKLVAITTNSDSKSPMLVLAPQDKNTGSSMKQVAQNLGFKVNTPEKQSSSNNFVLSNAQDGSQCLSLLSNKPIVVSSNGPSLLSTSHTVSTNSSKFIPTNSGSALTNTVKSQSVTLNLNQGQSSSLISGQQSKTVLATIGNQTLLLQLPVSEVKTSEGTSVSLISSNKSCTSQSVVMEATSKLPITSESDKLVTKPGTQVLEQYQPVTSSREPEKKIFVWKKKKCYETAPVPPKEIPPIRVIDFHDVMSLVRAAVKRHPVVCAEVDQSQHPYCAKSVEDWLSWNIGKRRASEWQRASTVRRFIMKQIGGLDSFKGTQLWTTKQIMIWCRLHAYSPHYLEKTLHPTPLELSADSNTMGKKFSSATDSTNVLLQLHDVQCSSRSDENSDDEIDIIGIEPPKVKIKEEISEIKVCDNPTSLPPSEEAIFIQDTALKIGVKFEPSEVIPEVFTSSSEDLIFTAMESFISELLTETFALKVNLGRYPDGIGVGDVYKALSSRSKFDFLTNRHLGVKDVGTDTVPR